MRNMPKESGICQRKMEIMRSAATDLPLSQGLVPLISDRFGWDQPRGCAMGIWGGRYPEFGRQPAALQLPPQEIDARLVRSHPRAVTQEAVNLVRDDELLEVHALLSQRAHQLHGLSEIHVAVVVSVDQKHRRFPGPDGCHR